MEQTTPQSLDIKLCGQHWLLHPSKVAFWKERSTLLIADYHLGKADHFRRSGIPVPSMMSDANHDRLIGLLLEFSPRRVLFLGDLFHSYYSEQHDELIDVLAPFRESVDFELILGNHDILSARRYEKLGLTVHPKPIVEGPFLFSHEPLEENLPKGYNVAGHLHPGIRLTGAGRQTMRLPCFWFGEHHAVLPAFGLFTGLATINPKSTDRVYVATDKAVLEV